jgi:hypothetical protein
MGIKVLPEIIDYEIRDVIAVLNEFDFLQTVASCSGYTGEDEISDGTEKRVWKGQPYVAMTSLNDSICLGDFLPFIASRMIFDSQASDSMTKISSYEDKLISKGLTYDGQQLCNFDFEYRNNRIVTIMYIRNAEFRKEYIEKIWGFFLDILKEYKSEKLK